MRNGLKRERYVAVRRRFPDPNAAAKRTEILEREDDWKGTCQFCGEHLKGTIAQLQAHRCEWWREFVAAHS